MNALETYQSDAVERPRIRRRLFWALVASLFLHAGVVYWFRQTQLAQFNAPTERLVPLRVFNLKPITISDSALEGEEQQAKPKSAGQTPARKPALKPLDLPDERPGAEVTEGRMTPSAPTPAEVIKPVASETPSGASENVEAITRAQESAAKVMEQDLTSLKDSLLKDQPPGASQSRIRLPEGESAAQSDAAGMAAASGALDKLLGRGLHAGDAPVTMPGGALFEFASADLRPASAEQLRKLGMLIKQSPDVTFTIEGYTDSFGDAAYNQQLSQQRADAVRSWLVQNMDVDPGHIQATGYGATRFLVAPQPVDMRSQASIDREKLLEQPNRRVEIRFKFHTAQ